MSQRYYFSAIIAFMLISGFGCAPRLTVRSIRPGDIHVGTVNTIRIADGIQGRKSAREYLILETARQIRSDGYFNVRDVSNSGIQLVLRGGNAEITGGLIGPRDALLRMDVYEWNSQIEKREEKVKDQSGREKLGEVYYGTGTVVMGATLVTAGGRIIIAEREYEHTVEIKTGSRERAVEAAANEAIREFLSEITPRTIHHRVRMDRSDRNQRNIIRLARRGDLENALMDMQNYLRRGQKNSVAHYNLAVILEALGRYEEALEHYDKAIIEARKPPRYYERARSQCARRVLETSSLSGE